MYTVTLKLPLVSGLSALGEHTTEQDIHDLFDRLEGRISISVLTKLGVHRGLAHRAVSNYLQKAKDAGVTPYPIITQACNNALKQAKSDVDNWVEEVYRRLQCSQQRS